MPGGGALFGSSATRSQNKNLVEFKAGKMTMKGKMVHPDKRKGLVYLYQSEDSLMHFCWKDRSSGTVEDDLIIFPDDCEFKKITQCTTGRVYILKFKSSNRKFFFWIQEPKTDKDEENARKINEVLNNPPTPGSQRSGGGTPDENLQNLLQNMSQQQLMQLFGGVGQIGGLSSLLGTISRPSTSQSNRSTTPASGTTSSAVTGGSTTTTPKPVTAAPTPTPSAKPTSATAGEGGAQNPIQLSDLQNFLSGLGVAGNSSSSNSQSVDLSSAITSETLAAVVNNPAVVEELQPHLPSTGTDGSRQEQLRSTLASPQFQQESESDDESDPCYDSDKDPPWNPDQDDHSDDAVTPQSSPVRSLEDGLDTTRLNTLDDNTGGAEQQSTGVTEVGVRIGISMLLPYFCMQSKILTFKFWNTSF